MNANRKAAEKEIIDGVEAILPGGGNKEIYEKLFADMTDEQFEAYMQKFERREARVSLIAPNLSKSRLSVARNLALAQKWNHNFFERVWFNHGNGTPPYLSPIPYLIIDLPLRRQAQILIKKVSIPEDNKTIDDLTGQPAGSSKGSKVSYPEIQVLSALGLEDNLTEMLKFRGGDVKGFDAMNTQINRTGATSLRSLEKLGTQVKSTQTLSSFLLSMHLSNTLIA